MSWWSASRRYLAVIGIAGLGIAECAMAAPEALCPDLPPVQTKIRFLGHHFELQHSEDLRRLDTVLDKEIWNTPSGKKDRDSMTLMRTLIERAFTAPEALLGLVNRDDITKLGMEIHRRFEDVSGVLVAKTRLAA